MSYQMFLCWGRPGTVLIRYEYDGERSGEDCRQQNETSAGDTDHQPVNGRAGRPLVTAIIQSSSATTVMVIGFVNAGLMNLAQATGVIMGANIGTTITAQIVALN